MWFTAHKRFVRHVCLSNPCLLILLWNLSPTPFQKLEAPESGSTLHQLCIMVASVASCLQKIELWYPSFGLQAIDCDLGCLIYATAASQWRIVEIEFLAMVGWKWGCQPFSCPCSKNVIHCPKEICSTCLSKESMPFVKSKPPLPSRSLRSLRAVARSTSSALWLHQLDHACKR